LLALTKYDKWKMNTNPDLSVSVTNAGNVLLQAVFNEVNQAPVQTSMYFEEISSDGLIDYQACCVGEASFFFGATFVPKDIPSQPIDRGFSVSRIIQLVDPLTNQPIGGHITEASIGQLVLTTIQIVVRDYCSTLKVVDAFPGALNPLDDSIYDNPSNDNNNVFSYYWRWYSGLNQREFMKDKVVFTGYSLSPSTYTVKYYSLVNTPGLFILPPAQAYDVFQPELMGSSEGGLFSTPAYPISPIVTEKGEICLPWVKRETPIDLLPPYLGNKGNEELNMDGNSRSTDLSIGLGVGLGIGIPAMIALALIIYKFFYYPSHGSVSPNSEL